MIADLPALPTIGTIAEDCGATQQKVGRVIRELGIQPVARAGMARVFSLEAVERIRNALKSDSTEGTADAS